MFNIKKIVYNNIILIIVDARVTEFDIKDYMENGMRIVGFRLTWIPKEDRISMINMVRKAIVNCCQKYDLTTWPLAISMDIPNVCICTGFLANVSNVIVSIKKAFS